MMFLDMETASLKSAASTMQSSTCLIEVSAGTRINENLINSSPRNKQYTLQQPFYKLSISAFKSALVLVLFVTSDLIQTKCLGHRLHSTRSYLNSYNLETTTEQGIGDPFSGKAGNRIVRASIGQPPRDAEQAIALETASNHEIEEEVTAGSGLNVLQEVGEDLPSAVSTNQLVGSKLHIVRLLAPEAAQNGTQNVTIDCMFKFDKKLDQRLTIKWFFNDELEPIYQWIPELNKRVYSDKYERFLDKSYEVSEDVDFMLEAYRMLLAGGAGKDTSENSEERTQLESPNRRLLATRLNKLAKLGGRHSRQLLDSLRAALDMDQLEWSRFRALRLVRPTTELSGRFTCSVSSLDGDDLRSTKLIVYEPAKSFSFDVNRVSSQLYNLTCRASQVFPRPSLALFRYRAGLLERQAISQNQPIRQNAHRPKLAATLLRQEPIPGTQTQLTVIMHQPGQQLAPDLLSESNDINPVVVVDSTPDDLQRNAENLSRTASTSASTTTVATNIQQPTVYDIASWALVDESSLSSNVVSQFECLLSIEGTGFEQRQSLALQKGWHVKSASLATRSTLVSLFSALASLLCLMLALISSMLIFRLLKRHAKNRVDQTEKADDSRNSSAFGGTISSIADASRNTNNTTTTSTTGATTNQISPTRPIVTLGDMLAPPAVNSTQQYATTRQKPALESDGVYRVPEPTFGTRFVIGPGSRQYFGNTNKQQTQAGASFTSSHQQSPTTISFQRNNQTKPLYC